MTTKKPDLDWPDLRVRRLLEKTYLEHAAAAIERAYPTHVWPRPADGSVRSLDPAAVQAGFVEGVRFACSALQDMANEAGSDAESMTAEVNT